MEIIEGESLSAFNLLIRRVPKLQASPGDLPELPLISRLQGFTSLDKTAALEGKGAFWYRTQLKSPSSSNPIFPRIHPQKLHKFPNLEIAALGRRKKGSAVFSSPCSLVEANGWALSSNLSPLVYRQGWP